MKLKLAIGGLWVAVATGVLAPAVGHAAPSPAGSTIANTAIVTFTDASGVNQQTGSNTAAFRVDEVINLAVTASPDSPVVSPGQTQQIVTFTVTNTGNGQAAPDLSANDQLTGDDFNPTGSKIYIDTNDNGVFDPGVDQPYTQGALILSADQGRKVFVVSNIPPGTADGQQGRVALNATSTVGHGVPGTIFAGKGTNGVDAIVGASGGTQTASSGFLVAASNVVLEKSAAVRDPVGGARIVPGSIITYALTARVTGRATARDILLEDPVPAGTSYVPASLRLGNGILTDAPGDDAGQFLANTISFQLGDVPSGETRTATFQVKIN